MEQTVWNFKRKLMGNLIPALLSLPLGIYGLYLILKGGATSDKGILYTAMWPVAMWITTNFFGLYDNGSMRRFFAKRFQSKIEHSLRAYFVGFSRPGVTGMLDPHEDVGFLVLKNDELEFQGELMHFKLKRSDITKISFRANVHSFVGLGRWIAIDGKIESTKVRLQIEPRERWTLIGNLLYSSRIKKEILAWQQGLLS